MNAQRSLGWAILLLLALLFLWAAVTGALADMVAAFVAPALLESTG